MSEESQLDMNDAHEAHAVFAMQFRCEACEKDLPAVSREKPYTTLWYRDLALLAKEKKWFAPPADADGKMDVMRAWCPECAAKLGLAFDGRVVAVEPSQRPPSDYYRL